MYTSNSELLPLLALSKLPFVTVGDIMQIVNGSSNTVENKVLDEYLASSGVMCLFSWLAKAIRKSALVCSVKACRDKLVPWLIVHI